MSINKIKIQEYFLNHPFYSELEKEEIERLVSEIHMKHENDDESLLHEFVDMYMLPGSGYGPNSGPSVGYGHSFSNGAGNSMLGGKSRQGVRVYGYDSNPVGGDAYAPFGNENGDYAQVVVPDKESSYKPWKVDMDDANNTRKNSNPNTTKLFSDYKEQLGTISDNIIDLMARNGVDINEFSEMTQEEIEDTIINFLNNYDFEPEQNFENKSTKDVVKESFLMDEDEELLEKKRFSKIQVARELLAKNHGVKDALKKDKNGRKYVISREDIEKLMSKFSYAYDENEKKWNMSKSEEISDKEDSSKEPTPFGLDNDLPKMDYTPKDTDNGEKDLFKLTPSLISAITQHISNLSDDDLDDDISWEPEKKEEDVENDEDIVNISKFKIGQARFILDAIHAVPEISQYNRKNELVRPLIKDSIVLEEMDKRGYHWDPNKKLWLDESNAVNPILLSEKNETIKSLLARSLLVSFGYVSYIERQLDGIIKKSTTESIDAIENRGWKWNDSLNKWIKLGELTEAVGKIDSTLTNELMGRMVLFADYLQEYIDNFADNTKRPSAEQRLIDKNPLPVKNKFVTPWALIEKELLNRGYNSNYKVTIGDQDFNYWSNKVNTVPTNYRNIYGDKTIEDMIERALVSSTMKKDMTEHMGVQYNANDPTKTKPIPLSSTNRIDSLFNNNVIQILQNKSTSKDDKVVKSKPQKIIQPKIQSTSISKPVKRNILSSVGNIISGLISVVPGKNSKLWKAIKALSSLQY